MMAEPAGKQLSFDEWRRLAQENPAMFEMRRIQALEAVISSAPAERQHRLRCLQWRVDQARNRATNPMGACLAISRMMWDSVHGPQGLARALDHLATRWDGQRRGKGLRAHSARVLPFRRPQQESR
ncbi:MAG: DUF3135 domain-containing protein [Ectothiorhodospiraceae bacterium]|nr:DUF3135 domain-containing protein [Ectothiorhodospiraceae bacterium]MCH8503638.1 DUF3135 domain-containing protein [Ectothiorhodospiraceae bacterium]